MISLHLLDSKSGDVTKTMLGEYTKAAHCGCSSAGALDLLAGFAPLEPNDGFLVEITNMPITMAMTMKVSAATTILLKCRRAGLSPTLASELIIKIGMLPLD